MACSFRLLKFSLHISFDLIFPAVLSGKLHLHLQFFFVTALKMKGFLKGFKYFSQIFGKGMNLTFPLYFFISPYLSLTISLHFRVSGYKEQEMEIGYPTDVRHITHIGWNSSSAHAPSWVSDYPSIPLCPTKPISILQREKKWDMHL